jgi:hypothetical protein
MRSRVGHAPLRLLIMPRKSRSGHHLPTAGLRLRTGRVRGLLPSPGSRRWVLSGGPRTAACSDPSSSRGPVPTSGAARQRLMTRAGPGAPPRRRGPPIPVPAPDLPGDGGRPRLGLARTGPRSRPGGSGQPVLLSCQWPRPSLKLSRPLHARYLNAIGHSRTSLIPRGSALAFLCYNLLRYDTSSTVSRSCICSSFRAIQILGPQVPRLPLGHAAS